MNIDLNLFNQVTAFIWAEADMLDHAEHESWLKLWDEAGLYIIPIDPSLTDYENHLNYAYDNHHMRQLRVERLENGEAISTSPRAHTVRSVSRIRILQDCDGEIVLRCAQNLREFRKENLKHYSADITFHLVRDTETGFKIQRKIINLINSTDTLAGISYIL
ncbi:MULTISPECIES: aromatic-ring-hydroxylating dioxygenase subunit beta [unclassified Acinetobacter]|uniref:aromatic-ring-hydroxylating dioxygenase subunit beta n=1 Tax=unclassified Acinetobacter TaxID=196816 RepID=UPI0029348366|nr:MULTISPECIES: aromatic-ring-hydroxylating dioxygenase subunit beta [unclassified Acinetobacter]WOE32617.1 aromatic-ring-hydroxylating dioxygenase subunit beta [Acinetobacter sp. SAAs470]WOE38093.1 aromatic-ring-hydroxylating dioxygenase subunit beta [Acinetobacter sp. SAAs474]